MKASRMLFHFKKFILNLTHLKFSGGAYNNATMAQGGGGLLEEKKNEKTSEMKGQ